MLTVYNLPYLRAAEGRVIKFCTQVGYINSQHMYKSPLKGHGQGHMTHFKFLGPNDISGMAEARINLLSWPSG